MPRFLTALALLLATAAHAQKSFDDSVRLRITKEKNDTEQVRMYVQLGNRLRLSDTAESQRCLQAIRKIAEEKNNDFFRGQAEFLAGTIGLNGPPAPAIGHFEKALKYYSQYPDNLRAQVNRGTTYINLGVLHQNNADYEAAIDFYRKAEDIYRKHNPKNADLALIYGNLSITYGSINRYADGLVYSKKALDWARGGNDKVGLMNAHYAYGGNLANMGDAAGLPYLDTAKALGLETNNLFYIYSGDFLKGLFYYKTKQWAKAKEAYTTCLAFAKQYNSTPDIGNNYLNLSAIELEEKNAARGKAMLDSATKYLDLVTPSISKKEYFENSAEAARQLGQYEQAFRFKDSATALKDSLYQADNVKQTEFRQARYAYERQQGEIERLEADRRIQALTLRQRRDAIWMLAGGLVLLLLAGFFAYRSYRQRQKLQAQRITELEKEKQLAATEAVLKGEEQERTRLAQDLHDGLGGMLSGIKYSLNTMKGNLVMTPENAQAFERSMDMLDGSIREMRRVAHNMMPEALLKFGLDTALRDFCADINRSGALQVHYQSIGLEHAPIDQTKSVTVYRIVQELLNNAIRHAGARSALVQLTRTDAGQLTVTVEDDGKGFDPAILKGSRGIGWSNIQSRVEFLKGSWDVDTEVGRGTSVHIELPG